MAITKPNVGWPHTDEHKRSVVANTLGMNTTRQPKKYQVYDDQVYERRIVHRFIMSDVEDVEIYVADPIYKWQQTDHGKWVMEHGKDQQYHINADPISYGYQVIITAHITPKRWTEYVLRGWFTG